MKETGILRNHDRQNTVCHIIHLEWSLVNGHVQYAVV
jgi:hypothetical protein